jgi:hypothetical protein
MAATNSCYLSLVVHFFYIWCTFGLEEKVMFFIQSVHKKNRARKLKTKL